MGKEIERKFIVKDSDWQEGASGVSCRQGYIPTVNQVTVRVRVMGDQGYITLKGQHKGITRTEYEYTVPVSDANQMLDTLCAKPIIEKTRYTLTFADMVWEIDVFSGENEGLVIAEVELEDEGQPVTLPSWVGEEVSHDPRYRNANLVRNPYKNW